MEILFVYIKESFVTKKTKTEKLRHTGIRTVKRLAQAWPWLRSSRKGRTAVVATQYFAHRVPKMYLLYRFITKPM